MEKRQFGNFDSTMVGGFLTGPPTMVGDEFFLYWLFPGQHKSLRSSSLFFFLTIIIVVVFPCFLKNGFLI
jgi:hypothetical protein